MNLVAMMQVGNEAELIHQNIAHHFSLGVDAFVVADIFSTDGTREILKEYESDPRFDIKYYERSDFFSASPISTQGIAKSMIESAKSVFSADWILRCDADEFWYPKNGDLKSLLVSAEVDAFSVRRLNVILPPHATKHPIPVGWNDLSKLHFMSDPFTTTRAIYNDDCQTPLNYIRIGPKVLARADALTYYSAGGHQALSEESKQLKTALCADAIVAHFWFTTLERFERKVSFIRSVEAEIRKRNPPGAGWKWSHWAEIGTSGFDAIKTEFNRQFPNEAQFKALLARGRISKGLDVFRTGNKVMRTEDVLLATKKADAGELGWLARAERLAGAEHP